MWWLWRGKPGGSLEKECAKQRKHAVPRLWFRKHVGYSAVVQTKQGRKSRTWLQKGRKGPINESLAGLCRAWPCSLDKLRWHRAVPSGEEKTLVRIHRRARQKALSTKMITEATKRKMPSVSYCERNNGGSDLSVREKPQEELWMVVPAPCERFTDR